MAHYLTYYKPNAFFINNEPNSTVIKNSIVDTVTRIKNIHPLQMLIEMGMENGRNHIYYFRFQVSVILTF